MKGHPLSSIYRIRVVHQGYTGGPGLTQFHFALDGDAVPAQADLDKAALAVRQFFMDFGSQLADGWTGMVDTEVDIFDMQTGALTNVRSVASQTALTGSGGAQGPAPVGLCVKWATADIVKGRRLSGRTFIVPMALTAFERDGTISPGVVTMLQAAGTKLAVTSGAPLVVWHRPVGHPGTGGSASRVTSASVKDQVAVLRSRRD
jgi:hypothetical protein